MAIGIVFDEPALAAFGLIHQIPAFNLNLPRQPPNTFCAGADSAQAEWSWGKCSHSGPNPEFMILSGSRSGAFEL
jgi:hypothetical protein